MTLRSFIPGQGDLFAELNAAEGGGTGGAPRTFNSPAGGAGAPSAGSEAGTAERPGATCELTLRDLLGPYPAWLIADLCEECGQLHGGTGCPAPLTSPPPGLTDNQGELTPLGIVVEDAANYLAAGRGYLDPDAEEYPAWVLAELADIAREEPCGPLCGTGPAGYLYPSQVADHFMDRREADWERWLPAWACDCGRAFKVAPGWPGTTFYEASPDGRAGSLAGHVTPDSSRRQVKHSGACPGCGRLFADTIARYPVTPRPSKPAPPPEQLPGLF